MYLLWKRLLKYRCLQCPLDNTLQSIKELSFAEPVPVKTKKHLSNNPYTVFVVPYNKSSRTAIYEQLTFIYLNIYIFKHLYI